MRLSGSLTLALTVASAGVSCSRPDSRPADSVAESVVSGPTDARWASELGELFVVPGDSDHTAIVLFPASPTGQQLASASLSLLRVAGDSTAATRAELDSAATACGDAPLVRLAAKGPSGWTIAFGAGVRSLPLDSIENLSAADSSALAAEVSRMASAIPTDTDSRFTGLPFGVLAAHRVRMGDTTLVIARAARRIPQEATPLEERTIMLAERLGQAPLAVKYHLRSEGPEDAVEHYALLGVVTAGGRPFVLVESEREAGTRYEILARDAAGAWRLRWSRALTC